MALNVNFLFEETHNFSRLKNFQTFVSKNNFLHTKFRCLQKVGKNSKFKKITKFFKFSYQKTKKNHEQV